MSQKLCNLLRAHSAAGEAATQDRFLLGKVAGELLREWKKGTPLLDPLRVSPGVGEDNPPSVRSTSGAKEFDGEEILIACQVEERERDPTTLLDNSSPGGLTNSTSIFIRQKNQGGHL